MKPENSGFRPFPETRWSLILKAGQKEDESTRSNALADLCTVYWPPVYAFIRLNGYSCRDAEDLTQGFFAKFLERNDFSQSDPARGKLRSFLLVSTKNYLADQLRYEGRQKRGGGALHFSIDASQGEALCLAMEPKDELTPDRLFDRQWATTLLEAVIVKLGDAYRASGKGTLFDALRPIIIAGGGSSEFSRIATDLEISESTLRVALHRLRQRYGKALRAAIADTLADGEDLNLEMQYLKDSFS